MLALAITVFSIYTYAADTTVSQKVLDAFTKAFPAAESPNWSELGDFFEVSFKQGTITSKVTYDKDANVIKTMRSYSQENLPIMILAKVMNKYGDKKINGVTEECSEEGVNYYITLEDDKNWTEVKSDSIGNLSVQKKYKKG